MTEPDDLDPTTAAYHEAGHALMAHRLGARVLEVSLEDEDDGLHGRTSVRWPAASVTEHWRRSALVALAGPLAEQLWRGEMDDFHALSAWHADWQEVQRALAGSHCQDPAALLQRWLTEVRQVLADPAAWEWLCRLADALEAHGTLDDDLLDLVLPPS